MAGLRIPIVSVVVGEGGSGGALAIGVCDRLLMLQYSTYSVISPEGCASILWKSADKAAEAAARLKITANHLVELGIVDQLVPEPPGGAHQDHDGAARHLDRVLSETLQVLDAMTPEQIREDRYQRFRGLGSFIA